MKSILIVLFSVVFMFGCVKTPEGVKLKSGLRYNDDKIGTGAEAKNGDMVEINFKVWLVNDSTNLFSDWSADSTKKLECIADSYLMHQTLKYILGSDGFIKGSDEGVIGMKTGGTRTIIVPSELAYGKEGAGPIPPNTSLKAVIELVSTKQVPVVKMWDVDSTLFKITSNGLKYAIIKEGEGPVIEKGKTVSVHYSGFLTNGLKFDSSVEREEPITFPVGIGQVIPGWDEGLLLLKKGSKARFIIPPALAYGERDLGKIPPNSTLIFDVEIVDVK